jgi:hypothetical protein
MRRRIGLIALAVSLLAHLLAYVFITGPDWFFVPSRFTPELFPSERHSSEIIQLPTGKQILLDLIVNVLTWTLVFACVLALITAVTARIRRHPRAT